MTTPETRSSVKRKLDLQKGTCEGECAVDNDSSTEVFLLLKYLTTLLLVLTKTIVKVFNMENVFRYIIS